MLLANTTHQILTYHLVDLLSCPYKFQNKTPEKINIYIFRMSVFCTIEISISKCVWTHYVLAFNKMISTGLKLPNYNIHQSLLLLVK